MRCLPRVDPAGLVAQHSVERPIDQAAVISEKPTHHTTLTSTVGYVRLRITPHYLNLSHKGRYDMADEDDLMAFLAEVNEAKPAEEEVAAEAGSPDGGKRARGACVDGWMDDGWVIGASKRVKGWML